MFMPSIRDMFDEDFDDELTPFFHGNEGIMKTDVEEQDNKYIMKVDVPGLKKEDIRLALKDGNLVISAARNENREEKDKEGHIIRQERYAGTYSRSFYVGKDVKEEDIRASLKDGVLRIEVPKKEEKPEVADRHYIEIE
jgi:HSP20 family molecular chaperone IbpA